MATLESVEAKIAKLQAQADALKKKRSSGVIAQIHSLMSEYGLSLEDLGSTSDGKTLGARATSKKTSGKSASVAKYKDPKSGATWSGHGRAPSWIANAKNRDRFLIDSSAMSASAEGEKAAKPGNYVRGKQPAMYRDPKTGKEWSGRGKAPSWLASARDRTKFLIDGTTSTTADGKGSAPKAVAAKKVAAKKTSATVPAKKGTAGKAAGTAAKTPAGKTVAARKSTSAAKKGPQAERNKVGATKAVSKKSGRKTPANATAAHEASPSTTSGSELASVVSAA
ncbi:Histone family protein nucleoid-structuring protein H-NS [Burkholderia sp. 8Y]|uniref:H-NS histone family protein n=1 Tax=Burkholderia sp. 8Y TaxID=2653133 RepID=UPI0012EF18AC|nr:H-NS family nucleoid-associated regulatory protein [Burkholderia sp. 8Y]VXC86270.1 Histone family protein nucleoid-structuring protein H-NS [Burkholderia sp. 8Y]